MKPFDFVVFCATVSLILFNYVFGLPATTTTTEAPGNRDAVSDAISVAKCRLRCLDNVSAHVCVYFFSSLENVWCTKYFLDYCHSNSHAAKISRVRGLQRV